MEFLGRDSESNSKCTRSNRLAVDDTCIMSEESGTDDGIESSRLETILDSEALEPSEAQSPRKTESQTEVESKPSLDDSRHTTPERSWRTDPDSREEQQISLNGKILKVKSALWVLGHAGTSVAGVEQLNNLGIVETIVCTAESCPYYSVRATAMYVLSLIATTRAGADALTNLDWPCVRHRRGDNWPIVPPANRYPVPSLIPIQRHHRSLSDGKPELPEPVARRTRNRSESAATDLETRRFALPECGETPSPVSSVQRLSQQDAEGYARFRSLQRHRRPSYSQSSLEMYSLDGRLSLESLSEYDSSRSWIADNILTPTPPPCEDSNENLFYMGISLPRKLVSIFPDGPRRLGGSTGEETSKTEVDTTEMDEESGSECDADAEHCRVCLICYRGKPAPKHRKSEWHAKLRREVLRHAQRLANPVWYRHSRQTLLRLRQRYPEIFQDACLFSDVSARLESGTYRIPARRFLQELFLDTAFDALYVDPIAILKIPVETAKSPPQSPASITSEVSNSRAPSSSLETKVNGRLTPSEMQAAQLTVVKEESTAISCTSVRQWDKSRGEILRTSERRSDEKIIADILNPEARIRLSKSSDRLLKVSGTNTAISLD